MDRSTIQLDHRDGGPVAGSPVRALHVKRSTSSDYANLEDVRPHGNIGKSTFCDASLIPYTKNTIIDTI